MVSNVPETSTYFPVTWQHPTLLEKQSKFPRYNMKCRGRHDTTVHEIFRIVSRFPCYFSCYITKKKPNFLILSGVFISVSLNFLILPRVPYSWSLLLFSSKVPISISLNVHFSPRVPIVQSSWISSVWHAGVLFSAHQDHCEKYVGLKTHASVLSVWCAINQPPLNLF